MLYYLDTCIVIYAVEGQPPFQQRARNHIAALENAGHRFVISDLVWTECLVHPLGMADGPLLLEYHQFFLGPHLATASWAAAIHQRAEMIRGTHHFGLADSLHLAAAVEYRLDRFLTNDNRLAGFTDINVEVLP
jgi:predicted nucleic acid-binding protein